LLHQSFGLYAWKWGLESVPVMVGQLKPIGFHVKKGNKMVVTMDLGGLFLSYGILKGTFASVL